MKSFLQIIIIITSYFIFSCSDDSNNPEENNSTNFYPMETNNQWEYQMYDLYGNETHTQTIKIISKEQHDELTVYNFHGIINEIDQEKYFSLAAIGDNIYEINDTNTIICKKKYTLGDSWYYQGTKYEVISESSTRTVLDKKFDEVAVIRVNSQYGPVFMYFANNIGLIEVFGIDNLKITSYIIK